MQLEPDLASTPTARPERDIVRRLRSTRRLDLNRSAQMVLLGAILAHVGITFGVLFISGHLTDYEPYSFFGILVILLVAGPRLLVGASMGRIVLWTVLLALAFSARNTGMALVYATQPKLFLSVTTLLTGFGVTFIDAPGKWPGATIVSVYLIPSVATVLSPLFDAGVLVYLSVAMVLNLGLLFTLRQRRRNIEALTIALSRSTDIDPLTGSASPGHLLETGRRLVARCRYNQRPVGVLFIDLDDFKQINLKHGYDIGDDVLVAVGDALRSGIRPTDLVGRMGGEEFVVVLGETDREGMDQTAARIRQRIQTNTRPSVTASIGMAWAARGATLDDLIERADEALGEAKKAGRDRAVSAAVPPQQSV
jgi:diguanylate cyclase (GGDEF)-like protein